MRSRGRPRGPFEGAETTSAVQHVASSAMSGTASRQPYVSCDPKGFVAIYPRSYLPFRKKSSKCS